MTDCITDCIGLKCPRYYICNPDEEPTYRTEPPKRKKEKLPEKLRKGWFQK